jgi:hypothetical protein
MRPIRTGFQPEADRETTEIGPSGASIDSGIGRICKFRDIISRLYDAVIQVKIANKSD